MSESAEKYSRKGLRTSYVSTVIGISLVLFMIGLVLGGMLGLKSIQTQAKENLQGDLFFKPEQTIADIKQIELEINTWPEFKEVTFISPDRAMNEVSGSSNNSKEILSMESISLELLEEPLTSFMARSGEINVTSLNSGHVFISSSICLISAIVCSGLKNKSPCRFSFAWV